MATDNTVVWATYRNVDIYNGKVKFVFPNENVQETSSSTSSIHSARDKFRVRSTNAGCIVESDKLLKIVRSGRLKWCGHVCCPSMQRATTRTTDSPRSMMNNHSSQVVVVATA